MRHVHDLKVAGRGPSFLEELPSHRYCHGFGAVCRAQLVVDFVQMLLDASLGETKHHCDVVVGKSACYGVKYFHLPLGERGRRFRFVKRCLDLGRKVAAAGCRGGTGVLSNQDLVNYPTVQPDECPE